MGRPTDRIEPNRLLDLDADVGQVKATIRYDVQDRDGNVIGVVHPLTSGSPTVAWSATARIGRTLRGFVLPGSEANDLDVFADRIAPRMVLEDGTTWPLGVFLLQEPERQISSWDSQLATTLYDLSYIAEQARPSAYSVPARGVITDHIVRLADDAGFTDYEVESSDARVLDPIGWPSGTSRLQMMTELAEMAGYHRPYVDNGGTLRCVAPAPMEADADYVHRYPIDTAVGQRGRVLVDTVRISPVSDAPGGHLVINSGATKGEVRAISLVDPDLPWSRERRGFLVLEVHRIQGIESTDAAQQVADRFRDQQPQTQATFAGPPDPRHDAYGIVDLAGSLYREVGWTLRLAPGGPHTHQLSNGGAPA